MVPETDYRELQALAEAQDRSISWLLREAFRLSRNRLHQAEPFADSFDRVWQDVERSLRQAGITTAADVSRLVCEVRSPRTPATKGKGR